MLRNCRLFLCLVCLGCHSLAASDPVSPTEPGADAAAQAKELWQKGQAAMKDEQPQQAIEYYEQSLAVDPTFTCSDLSLAAAYMEIGKEEAACVSLSRYLENHPEHLSVRPHLAEILLRLHRTEEARRHLERFISDAQDSGSEQAATMIHCHSRLMEIAEAEENSYETHLNRGIGLYLLALRRTNLADADEELPADGLLWKAAQELTQAQSLRPREARPCWYLYAVWHGLAQHQPAWRWLRLGLENAPFSSLTPAEQRGLYQAGKSLEKAL